ncbi:MAG: YfhO family protein, partial [Verrucomicrobiae bacterium]|nr:YfhO family protein [Verrucomicrobiae bacterium]
LRYYNIQALDSVQEPRMAVENLMFRSTFYAAGAHGHVRLWELTNTRFLLGLAGNLHDVLNEQFDPELRRFRTHTMFTLTQETPGGAIGVQTNTTGPYALIEFTGTLPRATLYFDWVIVTNDNAALQLLVNREFNPHAKVVVCSDVVKLPTHSTDTNAVLAARVEFVSYSPKRVVLRARAPAQGIVLLNDRYDPNWSAFVDGQRTELLRCNYLMRGVVVPPGEHTIEFTFQIPQTPLMISVAGILTGVTLLCVLLVAGGRSTPPSTADHEMT